MTEAYCQDPLVLQGVGAVLVAAAAQLPAMSSRQVGRPLWDSVRRGWAGTAVRCTVPLFLPTCHNRRRSLKVQLMESVSCMTDSQALWPVLGWYLPQADVHEDACLLLEGLFTQGSMGCKVTGITLLQHLIDSPQVGVAPRPWSLRARKHELMQPVI